MEIHLPVEIVEKCHGSSVENRTLPHNPTSKPRDMLSVLEIVASYCPCIACLGLGGRWKLQVLRALESGTSFRLRHFYASVFPGTVKFSLLDVVAPLVQQPREDMLRRHLIQVLVGLRRDDSTSTFFFSYYNPKCLVSQPISSRMVRTVVASWRDFLSLPDSLRVS
jgi:hypothetical protein